MQHSKWSDPSVSIEIGTMVLIKDDLLSSFHWPLGRVTAGFTGSDAIVRAVKVKKYPEATSKVRNFSFAFGLLRLALVIISNGLVLNMFLLCDWTFCECRIGYYALKLIFTKMCSLTLCPFWRPHCGIFLIASGVHAQFNSDR